MAEHKKPPPGIPNYVKFVTGALAGCGAVVFCQPIDVIKNRMQLSGEGGSKRAHKTSFHAVVNIAKTEGPLALYDGFSANIARQIFYTGTRMGVFQVMSDYFKRLLDETSLLHRYIEPSLLLNVEMQFSKGKWGIGPQTVSGITAGFAASIIACPTDVALVRMTSDRRLPAAQRRNYKNVFDAIIRMTKEEGIKTLWTGVIPTVARACVGNVAQLVTYVQAKEFLINNDYMTDGTGLHFVSSVIAGFVYAFSTTPMDVAKTRMQTMKIIKGKPEYNGMLDVWTKTVKKEGFSALWKGFGPYYFRIAPNTVLLFIFTERLLQLYKTYVMKDTSRGGGL